MRDAINSDARRAYAPDTSARTKRLDAMRAEYNDEKAALMADEDLTPEAKSRRLMEVELGFDAAFREESGRIMERLDADIERAYKRAHGPEKPSGYPEEDIAREMRLARIREEVRDDLESGAIDALVSYQEAARLGDEERAEVLARMGTRYLPDHTRRARLRQLAAENEPESRKKARRELERLEREKRHLDLAFALRRPRRRAV